MPNYCHNKLTIVGPETGVAAFVEAVRGTQDTEPTFAKTAAEEFLERQRRAHETAEERAAREVEAKAPIAFSFHRLVPIPAEIQAQPYDPAGYDTEKRLWGVKWGASESVLVERCAGRATYTFVTPWGPPDRVLANVAKLYPVLVLALSFGEELPSRGRFVFVKGEHIANEDVYDVYGTDCPDPPDEQDEDATQRFYDDWENKMLDEHDSWIARVTKDNAT
jgi:hypothetical protein